jgi:hypothetical protein
MQVTVNLDSFWVGFVAGWISLIVIGATLNARKSKKASETKTPAPAVRAKK